MKVGPALLAALCLAACDGGGAIDQSLRQAVRQRAIEACVNWVPESGAAAATGLDTGRLCACMADRLLEGKSLSELPEIRPGSPETLGAVAQCAADLDSRAPESGSW